jgi:hypothetical protein
MATPQVPVVVAVQPRVARVALARPAALVVIPRLATRRVALEVLPHRHRPVVPAVMLRSAPIAVAAAVVARAAMAVKPVQATVGMVEAPATTN